MSGDPWLAVERLRDRDLPAAERAALGALVLADPELRQAHLFARRIDGLLAGARDHDPRELLRRVEEAIAGSTPSSLHRLVDRVESGPARARRRDARRATGAVAAGAIAALIAVAALLLARGGGAASAAVIADGAGSGTVLVGGSEAPARAGARVPAGARIAVATGAITLRYRDGTELTLAAGASATVGGERDPVRLRLEHGRLSASVARQRPGARLAVATAELRIEVVGTRFVVDAAPGSTLLSVDEGVVAAIAASGARLEVAAGAAAVGDAAGVRGLPSTPDALGGDAGPIAAVAAGPDETLYLSLPWELDLAAGLARAWAEGRPLLLWVAWGDPLGPGPVSIAAARAALADRPLLRGIAARCVPVAIDSWWATRRTDAVGDVFRAIVGGVRPHDTTFDGFYLVAPDGRVLGDRQPDAGTAGLRALVDASAPTAPAPPGAAIAADDDARPPLPPAAGVAATVETRRVRRDGGRWIAAGIAGRDHLWLSAAEVRALAAAAGGEVDRAVAEKLARYVALDLTDGEAAAWDPAAVRGLSLSAEPIGDGSAGPRVRLRGWFDLDDGRRAYAAVAVGEIALDAAAGTVTAFALDLAGEWHDQAGPRTLAITARLASGIDARVPPHGRRDRGYLAAP